MCMHDNQDNSKYYTPRQSVKRDYLIEEPPYSSGERNYF